MKKLLSALLTGVMILSLTACDGAKQTREADSNAPVQTGADASAESAPKLAKLVVSGSTGEPTAVQHKMMDLFTEKYPEAGGEYTVCDTNTREQILKTAISAGEPPTVGFYWGTRINTFYNADMCLDLRAYLDEDLLNSINKRMLEPCIGPNGEVYAIPSSTVYHLAFYNKDMMNKYGFEIPETWDDLTEIFARLKEDGIYGFATNSASMQDCLYGMVYAELEAKVGKGTSYAVASGEESVAPGTPAGEVIRSCIEQVKEWYEAGYWYPGDGGINCTADDANAAFAQERCLVIFNFSGALGTHAKACSFDIGSFMKPTSAEGMISYENIEPDVYFIPSNCSKEQIASGIEFLKLILSKEVQQGVVDGGSIPAVDSYEYENISEPLKEIMDRMQGENLISGLNPTRTSSEMQTFIKQQIFAAPCGGSMTIDQTLEEMEAIRLRIKK